MDNNKRSRNPFNLINIKPASPANTKLQLPNFLSANVRFLFPKLDELDLLLQHTFSDVIDYAAEEEEFVPLYPKLYLPSGVMTSKAVTMNVCGCGLDLFASQDLLLE